MPLLIEAIKELRWEKDAELESLQATQDAMDTENTLLHAKVRAMEDRLAAIEAKLDVE